MNRTMKGYEHKQFAQPDEVRTFDKGRLELVNIGEGVVGRLVLEPGWRWSESVKPLAGTELCEAPHFQYHVSGSLRIVTSDGREIDARPGDVTSLPPATTLTSSATTRSSSSTSSAPPTTPRSRYDDPEGALERAPPRRSEGTSHGTAISLGTDRSAGRGEHTPGGRHAGTLGRSRWSLRQRRRHDRPRYAGHAASFGSLQSPAGSHSWTSWVTSAICLPNLELPYDADGESRRGHRDQPGAASQSPA